MSQFKKFKPMIIIAMIASFIMALVNMVNVGVFANDITDLAGNLGVFANYVDQSVIDVANQALSIMNSALFVFKAITISSLAFSLIAIIVLLAIVKYFTKRLANQESIFNYIAIIASSGYLSYYLFNSFGKVNNFLQILTFIVNLLVFALAIALAVYGVIHFVKYFKDNFESFQFEYVGIELLKVFSLVVAILAGINIAAKLLVLASVSSIISQVDIASVVDIMDYINVDITQMFPQLAAVFGSLSQAQIDTVINGLFDQYVLGYASNVVQNLMQGLANDIILNNIVGYIVAMVSAIATLVIYKKDYKTTIYGAIGLGFFTSIIIMIFVPGFLFKLCAIGIAAAVIVLCFKLAQEYITEESV